jgi:alpha-tubulin suppressor-like RCC1 family protein
VLKTRVIVFATVALAAESLSVSLASAQSNVVYAWGHNNYGQLGDGTTTDRYSPVPVPGLTGVAAVASGGEYSLARLSDGTVRAWGSNLYGQLGDGTTTDRYSPVSVPGLTGVASVAGGNYFSLAVLADGTLRTWGYNGQGALGDGTTADRHSPAPVPGLTGVTSVAVGGAHSLALLPDGTLRGWGLNVYGELGDGTNTFQRNSPQPVPGLTGVATVGAGSGTSFAILPGGTLRAWGYNYSGQVGVGFSGTNVLSPTAVPGVAGVRSVVGGAEHSLALLTNGTVLAWGWNAYGQLGDGSTNPRYSPLAVPGLTNIVDVETTDVASFALSANGRLWAWGYNSYGDLGLGDTTNRLIPTEVHSPLAGYKFGSIAVSEGSDHMLAVLVPVPAPAGTALLGLGGLLACRRRR